MRIKNLVQEHNTVTMDRLEPGPFNPQTSRLAIRPPCLPHLLYVTSLTTVGNTVMMYHQTRDQIIYKISLRKVFPEFQCVPRGGILCCKLDKNWS